MYEAHVVAKLTDQSVRIAANNVKARTYEETVPALGEAGRLRRWDVAWLLETVLELLVDVTPPLNVRFDEICNEGPIFNLTSPQKVLTQRLRWLEGK